ncbi:hypothetical protein BKA69DRAFT_654741 [Paraphysoderma sedebokerense]|nr:hypothetical protein BKA69DRAFT_654741 [Paraphysoderma sedebokerense]
MLHPGRFRLFSVQRLFRHGPQIPSTQTPFIQRYSSTLPPPIPPTLLSKLTSHEPFLAALQSFTTKLQEKGIQPQDLKTPSFKLVRIITDPDIKKSLEDMARAMKDAGVTDDEVKGAREWMLSFSGMKPPGVSPTSTGTAEAKDVSSLHSNKEATKESMSDRASTSKVESVFGSKNGQN